MISVEFYNSISSFDVLFDIFFGPISLLFFEHIVQRVYKPSVFSSNIYVYIYIYIYIYIHIYKFLINKLIKAEPESILESFFLIVLYICIYKYMYIYIYIYILQYDLIAML